MSIEASLAEKAAVIKGKTKARKKPTWVGPEMSAFSQGAILAFDQTFAKTGWVFFTLYGGVLSVLDKGFLQEPPIPDKPKFEDILQRSEWMHDRMMAVIQSVIPHEFKVVHEAPILHGMRVEASLLGALALRLALRRATGMTPHIVENRRMLSVLVPPDQRLDMPGKSHITRALLPYWDTRKGWNEHNRDSLALGLTYLHDKALGQHL